MAVTCQFRRLVMGVISALLAATLPAEAEEERIYTHEDGTIRARPLPVPERLANPWPDAWEDQMWRRAQPAIERYGEEPPRGGTFGENEKNYYPRAMFNIMARNRERGLEALQEEDNQADDHHAHTLGIDYYWTFTLKGQMRKYFYFGPYLDEDYRQRMYDAAEIWTEEDPAEREHPRFGTGSGEYGYGPEQRGYWVDRRGTDNMRIMRYGSVYLMAEETGNEQTADVYEDHIRTYVRQLFHVGMPEWDSPNYHGHTQSAFHNIHDFAGDEHVQGMAKAGLDWLYAAAALKYWRGGFGGGAMARHHGGGNYEVFQASPVHPLYLYAGDTPIENPRHDRDDVHHLTSGYRPPPAVVELARKSFERPVELYATKPPYDVWEPGDEDFMPRYWETMYIGETFQMGSVVSEEPEQTWAVAPFSLMAYNSERGVDYFVARSDPMPGNSRKNPGDQIGQYANLMIWLRPAGDPDHEAFYFLAPDSAEVREEEGVWFFEYEDTWIALHPIHLASYEVAEHDREEHYAQETFLRAAIEGETYGGFAMEVGEAGEHDSFEEFREAVLEQSRLDTGALDEGAVELAGTDGKTLALTFNQEHDLPDVVRDGETVDWRERLDLYATAPESPNRSPIELGWREGELRIEAGGEVFEGRFDKDGSYTFENR
ncbi:MAG: hypothetical protein ACLFU6_10555 [Candidatus Hydrogenedentota bacterium]